MTKPLIVVTGASQGIGRAVAGAFGLDGHPLLLLSRHPARPDLPPEARLRMAAVDVVDYAAMASAIAEAEAAFGPVDCLVNNAGFLRIGEFAQRSIDDIGYEADVLFKGVLNGVRAVLPGMQERGRGTIVNISSLGDRKPGPGGEVYHASKAAVRSLSESLQLAQAKHNIRVMNVAPAFVRTGIHADMGISFEEYQRQLNQSDFLSPEEIAEIVMFCYRQPQHLCIRDLVVLPTSATV